MNPRANVVHAPVDRRPQEGQTEALTSEPPPVRTAQAVRLSSLPVVNGTCPAPAAPETTAPVTPPARRARLLPLHRRLPSINPQTDAFRQRFFPTATLAEWNDWRWQSRHRITKL